VRIEEAPPDWQRAIVSPAYIIGSRVTLRHISLGFSHDEIVRQYRWGLDEELQYWSGSVPTASTVAQFEQDVVTWTRQRDARRDRYAILNEHDEMIGMISYYNVVFERGQAELGIYIGDHGRWGKGYGTEAILTLLSHLFRHTGLRMMYLTTYASNARAQACYRKCGFEVTGTMRKYSSRAGYYVDVQMRLSRERFMALHGHRPVTIFNR
jgi:RimJ/RimL family protein N-acetyltransferase